jgi:hypothetical protein
MMRRGASEPRGPEAAAEGRGVADCGKGAARVVAWSALGAAGTRRRKVGEPAGRVGMPVAAVSRGGCMAGYYCPRCFKTAPVQKVCCGRPMKRG